jgi:hypothetical protein
LFDPATLTGAVVREVRDQHKLSRVEFCQRAGFTGKSTARLSNIETKNSWKPGDRDAVARVLNELAPNFDPRFHVQPAQAIPEGTPYVAEDDDLPIVPVDPDADDDVDDALVSVGHVPVARTTTSPVPEPVDVVPTSASLVVPDGSYPVSNSELQTWKRCRRKWWLAWYQKLALRTETFVGVRSVGDRIHRALERWYVPDGTPRVDPRDALERVVVEDWTQIARLAEQRDVGDERLGDLAREFAKSTNLERAMVEGYVQWLEETGADAELRVIAAETPLSAQLELDDGRPVTAIGKLDVRVKRVTDDVNLLLDHKPHPLTTPILTPTGWIKIGELNVGDVVCGLRGEPVRVTNVFDRGIDDVYEITLNDGTTVRSTSDHPWVAKDTHVGHWRLVETKDLKVNRHRLRHIEPQTDDVDVSLPIDPYTLGAWIANGNRYGSSICDGVSTTLEATGFPVKTLPRRSHHTQTLYQATLPIEVRNELDELNLLGRYSSERFIPDVYVHRTSYAQRLALLHGLMDGDGCLTTTRSSIYVTTSERLARDVIALVQSLGGWAKFWTNGRRNRVVTKTGSYETNNTAYCVSVRSTFVPFKHVQHAVDWVTHKELKKGRKGTKSSDRIVKSIKFVGREPVRCIELDSQDKMYVVDGYTVSHNTVGDVKAPAVTLPQNEQMTHYMLLEWLQTDEGEARCDGALYNMLKRSQRTARATPPFYDRIEVRHNRFELESYRRRLLATSRDVLDAIERLDRGDDHLDVVYPSPRGECRWDCSFFAVCNLIDDGSAGTDDMFNALYHEVNPRDRYDVRSTDE